MIWFSSDYHFGHTKDFLLKPRGFNSTFENSQKIIANHNAVVDDEDDVYILGDLMLEDNEYGIQMLEQLKGKLHIILGNHDTVTREALYLDCRNVVEVCQAKIIKIGKQHYFLCHYPTFTANYDDKPYHNHLINLYGHTHQQDNFFDDNPFMYHVGVDSHNCKPVSAEQISEDIHRKVQEIYTENQRRMKELEDYYENGLGYFERHRPGVEILDD